jgi:quercetin dioxygenase-like cupin family protein
MDPIPTPVETPDDAGNLSRRTMIGASATGLALALLARSISQTSAQEGTPAAEGGMPEGLAITPMTNLPIPAADVPAGGFTVSVYRITLEPGAEAPVSSAAYPTSGYVESGTLTCPGGAPRFIIAADGSVREVGDEDVIVNTGEAIYIPPDVPDGARNDGTDLVSILAVDLIPMEGMATPSA